MYWLSRAVTVEVYTNWKYQLISSYCPYDTLRYRYSSCQYDHQSQTILAVHLHEITTAAVMSQSSPLHQRFVGGQKLSNIADPSTLATAGPWPQRWAIAHELVIDRVYRKTACFLAVTPLEHFCIFYHFVNDTVRERCTESSFFFELFFRRDDCQSRKKSRRNLVMGLVCFD